MIHCLQRELIWISFCWFCSFQLSYELIIDGLCIDCKWATVIGENTDGNLPFGVQAVAHAAVNGGGCAGDHQEFLFCHPRWVDFIINCRITLGHSSCIISTSRENLWILDDLMLFAMRRLAHQQAAVRIAAQNNYIARLMLPLNFEKKKGREWHSWDIYDILNSLIVWFAAYMQATKHLYI